MPFSQKEKHFRVIEKFHRRYRNGGKYRREGGGKEPSTMRRYRREITFPYGAAAIKEWGEEVLIRELNRRDRGSSGYVILSIDPISVVASFSSVRDAVAIPRPRTPLSVERRKALGAKMRFSASVERGKGGGKKKVILLIRILRRRSVPSTDKSSI